MSELKLRGSFARKSAVMKGTIFIEEQVESSSLIGRVASGLYSYTFGSLWGSSSTPSKADPSLDEEEDDPDIFVNVEFLNR